MPRILLFLAVLVPICGLLYVVAPQFELLKSVASFPLSWPFATHPEAQLQQPHENAAQQPLRAGAGTGYRPGNMNVNDVHAAPGQYTRRIVAVGDLHGDIQNAQTVLKMAGVVDAEGNWSGHVDFFVQTGDIIDRGDDTIKLYNWMEKLREQAHAVGGTVLSLLGNHEWMNVIGDWRYVYPSEIDTFGSVAARQQMLSKGPIGKSWAANYTTASRLPLHPSVGPPNADYDPSSPSASSPLSHAAISFVHGGLAPSYPDLTPFPSRINSLGASLLHKLQARQPPPPHPPHAYPGLPEGATEAEKRLYGTDGPLWYRGWALEPEDVACAKVDKVLKETGTRRMIMGHTPDFEKIISRCNGKIIIIDTGISHAYGGALSALAINYTLLRSESGEWREREVIAALYADKHEFLAIDERNIQGDFGGL